MRACHEYANKISLITYIQYYAIAIIYSVEIHNSNRKSPFPLFIFFNFSCQFAVKLDRNVFYLILTGRIKGVQHTHTDHMQFAEQKKLWKKNWTCGTVSEVNKKTKLYHWTWLTTTNIHTIRVIYTKTCLRA